MHSMILQLNLDNVSVNSSCKHPLGRLAGNFFEGAKSPPQARKAAKPRPPCQEIFKKKT